MAKLDQELDRLFQVPLAEFTDARNVLTKTAGNDAASVKSLTKPPLSAWAVNQLYWRERPVYDALIQASTDMRRAHKAVLEGRAGDLRTTGRAHDAAVDAALKATLGLLRSDGQPVTDATRQSVLNTLRALPADETPGRLTRALAPGGFEMLAGISPGLPTSGKGSREPRDARARGVPEKTAAGATMAPKGARVSPSDRRAALKAEKEAARIRERREALERAVREADQRARQTEFEAARAAREATRAEERLAEAERALNEAQNAAADAERELAATAGTKKAADKRARDAAAALATARARAEHD